MLQNMISPRNMLKIPLSLPHLPGQPLARRIINILDSRLTTCLGGLHAGGEEEFDVQQRLEERHSALHGGEVVFLNKVDFDIGVIVTVMEFGFEGGEEVVCLFFFMLLLGAVVSILWFGVLGEIGGLVVQEETFEEEKLGGDEWFGRGGGRALFDDESWEVDGLVGCGLGFGPTGNELLCSIDELGILLFYGDNLLWGYYLYLISDHRMQQTSLIPNHLLRKGHLSRQGRSQQTKWDVQYLPRPTPPNRGTPPSFFTSTTTFNNPQKLIAESASVSGPAIV